MEVSFENLAMQLGLISSQVALKLRSSGNFNENNLDTPRDKEIGQKFKQECRVVDEGRVEKEKEEEKCTMPHKEIEARIEATKMKKI